MPRQPLTSRSESKLAETISRLERKLIEEPKNIPVAKKLLLLLDSQSSDTAGDGLYSRCQRALAAQFRGEEIPRHELTRDRVIKLLKGWALLKSDFNINKDIRILQIFDGKSPRINDVFMDCGGYMNFFKENKAIMSACFSCYKVQILAPDVISLIQIYFIIRDIKLNRDNSRKCMVEAREDFSYPYKGYVYCESEDEAHEILHQLKAEMSESGLNNVFCAISHGCSEYGLAYPEFKYSEQGKHRDFKQPADWKQLEKNSYTAAPNAGMNAPVPNKSEVTLRDVICFETWLQYAEIIGDPSYQNFAEIPLNRKPDHFTNLVKKQAAARNAQMVELQQRQYVG